MAEQKHSPHSPELQSGKLSSWLRDPGRPCVFWVITGFSILSAGRGHVVETGVLEPVPHWGPILLLLLRLLLSSSFSSHSLYLCSRPSCASCCVCFNLSKIKPRPPRNSLCLFLLSPRCSFISSFFFFSWPFLFLYHFNLTLQALPCLPHAPLYAARIIGLAACLSKKIEGLFYIV